MRLAMKNVGFAGLAALVLSTLASSQTKTPENLGAAVYQQRCATCHDSASPRIPPRSVLNQMPAGRIVRALDFGAMMTVAYPMSRDERTAVAAYLGTDAPAIAYPATAYCRDRGVRLPDRFPLNWNGWSPSTANTRFQPAQAAGLNRDNVGQLKVKWAFGFDGDVTAFAPPTVVNDYQVFVGSAGGVVHAMRADTGCLQWTFQANGPVRSSILVVPSGSKQLLLFGDQSGWFYALDAVTGALAWKKRVDEHDAARLTGSPVVSGDRVFVPVASWEETRALDPTYACCTFRGSVVALSIRDGAQVWKSYLVDKPKETGTTKSGTRRFGPSGAPVWAAPTLDAKRGLLYLATGDNYSSPATSLSDAIVAMDQATGRVAWSSQTTPNVAYNSSCGTNRANCPDEDGPDHDFGASAILSTLPDGRDVLFAGQKSGMVFALDPDQRGRVLWKTRIAEPMPNVGTGVGVLWGMASDADHVYAATASSVRRAPTDPLDVRRYILDPKHGGGLTALRKTTGEKVWHAPPIVCAPAAPEGCSPAQSAAVTAVPGVVFSGSMDGHIRAYDAQNGKILWDADTAREFPTVNGIKARGGTIDGAGPVVVNGTVFVNSGYSRFGGMPGNVLLAFAR